MHRSIDRQWIRVQTRADNSSLISQSTFCFARRKTSSDSTQSWADFEIQDQVYIFRSPSLRTRWIGSIALVNSSSMIWIIWMRETDHRILKQTMHLELSSSHSIRGLKGRSVMPRADPTSLMGHGKATCSILFLKFDWCKCWDCCPNSG